MPTVVYIEDDPDNFELVLRVLRSLDLRILGAADGEAGLELVRRERPDLVLLDLDLPGLDGFEVLEQLKADEGLNGTPVVAITANVMRGERRRCLDAGCADYMEKPFDIESLRLLVADLLARVESE